MGSRSQGGPPGGGLWARSGASLPRASDCPSLRRGSHQPVCDPGAQEQTCPRCGFRAATKAAGKEERPACLPASCQGPPVPRALLFPITRNSQARNCKHNSALTILPVLSSLEPSPKLQALSLSDFLNQVSISNYTGPLVSPPGPHLHPSFLSLQVAFLHLGAHAQNLGQLQLLYRCSRGHSHPSARHARTEAFNSHSRSDHTSPPSRHQPGPRRRALVVSVQSLLTGFSVPSLEPLWSFLQRDVPFT